jgi:hypothetical protein
MRPISNERSSASVQIQARHHAARQGRVSLVLTPGYCALSKGL